VGRRGLYEAPAVEHKACPPAMGGELPCAIKYPIIVGLGCLQVPVTAVGEVLGCQRVRDTGKEVNARWNLCECANSWSDNYPLPAEDAQFRVESFFYFYSR